MTSTFPDGHEEKTQVFTCFPIGARPDDYFVEDAVQGTNNYWISKTAPVRQPDGSFKPAPPLKDGALARVVGNPKPFRTGWIDALFARN